LTKRSIIKPVEVSPRTKEQFEAIRIEKEKLILEVALNLFARNGYASTSVSMISKEAGISKGLMYNYFASKEDLLKRIIIGGLQQFTMFLNVKDISHVKKEELIDFIDGNLEALKNDTDFYKLYFSLAFQAEVFAMLEVEMMKIFGDIMAIFINYYQSKGETDPFTKTRFILAVFDGVGIHYILDTETFPLGKIRDIIIGLL
jgi:AcrR family transcriptional regulator